MFRRGKDGWWLTIREGKTEAAVRDIPVHDSVIHVLARRKRDKHKYLFEGLVPGGPDNKRSWNISKAFGHLYMACSRFRRHRVRCFDGTGGESWRDEGLRGSSNLKLCG